MDRQEVWEHIVEAVGSHFESAVGGPFAPGEFRVESNDAMRTISVIECATSQSLGLLDISFAYFTDEGGRTTVHLPPSSAPTPNSE